MKNIKRKQEEMDTEENMQDSLTPQLEEAKKQLDQLKSQLVQYQEQQILSDDRVFRFYLVNSIVPISKALETMNETMIKIGKLIESKSPSSTNEEEEETEEEEID